MSTFTATVDADLDQVVSLGGPPGQVFELPLYGCSASTPDGQQANVLIVLSGIAVPATEALENPDPQEREHHGTLVIDTEYRTRSSAEQLCGAALYVTLASIDNDDEVDLIGIGFGTPRAINTASVRFEQDPGQRARIVLTVDPIALDGDTTVNRLSYQAYLAIYRPELIIHPRWLIKEERTAEQILAVS
jgi:hypothetical protein